MTTNILSLPVYQFEIVQPNNGDWLDGIQYLDSSGNPISLAGISFEASLGLIQGLPLITFSTTAGTLSVGGASNSLLFFAVPFSTLSTLSPGKYRSDIQGTGDGHTRIVGFGTVDLRQGMTP